MFDDNNETCWNSDQGSPQYIIGSNINIKINTNTNTNTY